MDFEVKVVDEGIAEAFPGVFESDSLDETSHCEYYTEWPGWIRGLEMAVMVCESKSHGV